MNFVPELHAKAYRSIKNVINKMVWDKNFSKYLLSSFTFEHKTCEPATQYGSQIISFKEVVPEKGSFELFPTFKIVFADKSEFIGRLDEDKVIELLFEEHALYSAVGRMGMICLDVAHALGGSEAIVETYYSVMKHQAKDGGQSNEVLQNRTLADWSCPNIMQAEKLLQRAAWFYLNGDQENLGRHEVNFLKNNDKNSYKSSKILVRLHDEEARLPFLSD